MLSTFFHYLPNSSSGGISSLSPSGRDAVDPIAELLSQLSGVRRSNPTQGSASAQLQQLQMQLQLERQQVRVCYNNEKSTCGVCMKNGIDDKKIHKVR